MTTKPWTLPDAVDISDWDGFTEDDPAAAEIARNIETGRDITVQVDPWTRQMAVEEFRTGGLYATAVGVHGDRPQWPGFAREVFGDLYGLGVQEVPADQRPLGHEWVSELWDHVGQLPEYKGLAKRVQGDPWACGLAAGEIVRVAADACAPPDRDPQDVQDEIDLVKDLQGGKTSTKHLRKIAELAREAKDAQEQAQGAAAAVRVGAPAIRTAVRKAIANVNEKLDEVEQAMAALGHGNGAGMVSRVDAPPAELRKAILANPELLMIATLAGRLKAQALDKRRTIAKPGREELCDVTQGSDVARLLPSELLALADDTTEAQLYRRLMEDAALQYELRGHEQKSEGPIIMAVDESGSMSGDPDRWAKAIALALMELCARDNRPFVYIHFDSAVTRVDRFDDPKRLKLDDLLGMVEHFTGGGTDFVGPLNHAAEIIEQAGEANPFSKADLVLVTDGDWTPGWANDKDAWAKVIDRLHAASASVFGVVVHGRFNPDVEKRLDKSIRITKNDLTAPGGASETLLAL